MKSTKLFSKKNCVLIAMVISIFFLCGMPAVVAGGTADIGSESLRRAVSLFPNYYSETTRRTQPIFTNSAEGAIAEYVYIEVPTDTDRDGARDLIRVVILRQSQSGPASDPTKIQVPVLMSYSVYNGTGNNITCEDYHFEVELEQKLVSELETGDTSDYTYQDVKTKKIRASEWPWSDEPFTYYENNSTACPVPASRGSKPIVNANTMNRPSLSGFNGYMFNHGYAYVLSASYAGNVTGQGTDESGFNNVNDGLPRCGDVEETIVATSIVQWLNGNCRAYTDRTCQNEVVADWCNGSVAMKGTSYDGTIPMAVASTGVDGIKAIIPIAGIPSYYEYYRGNGAMISDVQEQGSDCSWLGSYILPARYHSANAEDTKAHAMMKIFNEITAMYESEHDRDSGDYNRYWDTRNFIPDVESFKAGILIEQGFSDTNVQPVNFDIIYRAMKKYNPDYPIKALLHQQAHTSIDNLNNPTYNSVYALMHQWLDHFCWDIDNGVVNDGIGAWIVDSATGEFSAYSHWPIKEAPVQKYYLNHKAGEEAGRLAATAQGTFVEEAVYDSLFSKVKTEIAADNYANSPFIPSQLRNHLSGGTQTNDRMVRKYWDQWRGDAWESFLMKSSAYDVSNSSRLVYITEPLEENVLLSGTVEATLNLSANMGKGTISVAIVEVGSQRRGLGTTSSGYTEPGFAAVNKYQLGNTVSDYYIVTRGHTDLQNPNPSGITYINADPLEGMIPPFYYQTIDVKPGESYSYTFTLEPCHYTFRAGTQLAVLVYTTDYRYTMIPSVDITKVSVNLGEGSYIGLPLTGVLPGSGALNVAADKYQVKKGESFTVGVSFKEQIVSNTAILAVDFDAEKFQLRGFTPAEGVTLLNQEVRDGTVFLTVMVDDYATTAYGDLEFSAHDDVALDDVENTVCVAVQYVVKDEDGEKTVETAYGSTGIYTVVDPFEGLEVSLIDLSNIIDIFGYNKSTEGWFERYRAFDFNGNGEIDISDITYVASLIK